MDMKAYLAHLGDDVARRHFAARCQTTVGHLRNIAGGTRPCNTEIAVAAERESGGKVTRVELCPDTWRKRWPELAAPKNIQRASKAA